MNKYRSAKLVSDELVVTEAENNQTSVDKIPAFAEGIVKLKALNTQTRAAMTLQQQSIEGVTTEKGNAHEHLVEYTIDIAGGLHAYAESKNDNVLKAKVTFSNTEIEHQIGTKLINTATNILSYTKSIAADDLAHNGITAEELTAFENALKLFSTLKSSPKEAKIEHSGYTDTIEKLQSESQQILNILDKLATQFKRKAPAYYDIYIASRKNGGASPHQKKDTNTDTTPTK